MTLYVPIVSLSTLFSAVIKFITSLAATAPASIYVVVLSIVTGLLPLIPIFSNSIRNTLLALIITLNINIRDKMFIFFHDSYGSLIFSLISLLIISYLYFNLLEKELNL